MANLARFSVSIDTALLERFIRYARARGFGSRSEALRFIIRDALVQEEWERGQVVVGTITIIYDHHKRQLSDQLTKIQHKHHEAVLAVTHIHLDADNCLEMIAVRGEAAQVRAIADALIGARGVKHGKLTLTTMGKDLG